MNPEHDIAIPLYGGPFDGELITTKEGRLPRSVPWPDGGLIHVYTLTIDESADFVEIRYTYAGCHSYEKTVA
jgi:hypothetical protein